MNCMNTTSNISVLFSPFLFVFSFPFLIATYTFSCCPIRTGRQSQGLTDGLLDYFAACHELWLPRAAQLHN